MRRGRPPVDVAEDRLDGLDGQIWFIGRNLGRVHTADMNRISRFGVVKS